MPYEIHPYSIDILRDLFAQKANADLAMISKKSHCDYFESYFKSLNAKTILVENDYIDRDFLEDFSAYYVRCHHPYKRHCSRLHFFDIPLTIGDFEKVLKNGSVDPLHSKLKTSYLGFIVVKPLPRTVIGRTCLRTYDACKGKRLYPITRTYGASLFGIDLSVDTLAFQEQDHVVAACATSSLWSAFHGTGILFQHSILSPVEITKAASTNYANRSRNLPNHGLTPEQMALAIRSVGLEPFIVNASDEFVFKSTLYAYLCGRVPTLILGGLYDIAGGAEVFLGMHAMAGTGMGFDFKQTGLIGPNGFLSISCFIDRIYAHDDQVGPFARMLLDGVRVNVGKSSPPRWSLSTSWPDSKGKTSSVRFAPDMLLVPLYHKIRIPFGMVQEAILKCDAFFEVLRLATPGLLHERLRWDIRLTTVKDYKADVYGDISLIPDLRYDVLCTSMPRYLWRATGLSDGKKVMDLLFDATDIEQGNCIVRAVKIDCSFSSVLKGVLANPAIIAVLEKLPHPVRAVLKQFK